MPRVHLLSVRTGMRYNGPLFDHRARRAFREFQEDLENEAAEFVLDNIKDTFHTHFKRPTGYYESNVRITNVSGSPEVWDGGMAGPRYGPWLEGVGSRNNTTRFKGYHAFRKAAQDLDARIEGMGDRIFRLRYRNRLE
jgi:hypothetical protein